MRRRTTSPPQETIEICKDYEFLVLFTSTVGWEGDQRLAEAIKAANPSIRDRLRRPAGDHRSRPRAERVLRARLHLPPRVRLLRRGVCAGQAAQRDSRHQLQEGRQDRPQSRPPADRRPGRDAVGDQDLQARHGRDALQRALPAASRTSRSTPRAAARRSAPSACGRRR